MKFAQFKSTKTVVSPVRSSPSLLNKVSTANDPRASIVPILDRWVREGETVSQDELQSLIRTMQKFNRPQHALEISQWMTDRRFFDLKASDVAVRLKLIYSVHGLEHTEKYFNNLSKHFKAVQTYSVLLDCYTKEKRVDKAEAIMHEMKTTGFMISAFPYNWLIRFYTQTGQQEKICTLLLEMEEKGIPQDKYTITGRFMGYLSVSDIDGMDKILNLMDDPNTSVDWSSYAIVAQGYRKVGIIDKLLEVLKKIEEMTAQNRTNKASVFLLTLYGKIGKKDDVYKIWNTYKCTESVNRSSCPRSAIYSCMISSLGKLGDIEGAEKIFNEWVSFYSIYPCKVLNSLIWIYCKRQLLDKAEALIQKAIESGTSIAANTWDILAMGYISDKQMSKGVETLKKAFLAGGEGWKPSDVTVTTCLEYFEVERDVKGADDFVELFGPLGLLTREMYHKLLIIYNAADKPVSRLLDLMKAYGFSVDDETQNLLQSCGSKLNEIRE